MKTNPFFWRNSYADGNKGKIEIPGHAPLLPIELVMVLTRRSFLSDCTRGTVIINQDVFETLEPVRRTDGLKPRCIPPGKYKVVLEYSKKFDKILPELKGVPGFDEAKFHRGNYAHETDACILPGLTGDKTHVWKSLKAVTAIIKHIEAAEKAGIPVYIQIIEKEAEK